MLQHSYRKNISTVLFMALTTTTLLTTIQAATQAPAQAPADVQTVYRKTAEWYLPSLGKQQIAEEMAAQELAKQNSAFLEKKQLSKIAIPSVGPIEKLQIQFDIFHLNDPSFSNQALCQPLIDPSVVADLDYFCGPKGSAERHLFGKIDHTITGFGKIELLRILSTPLTNQHELIQRQQAIKELVDNPTLFSEVDTLLKRIAQDECQLTWFWKILDVATQQFFDQVYIKSDGSAATSNLNKNPYAMHAWHTLNTVGYPAMSATWPILYQGATIMLSVWTLQLMQLFGAIPNDIPMPTFFELCRGAYETDKAIIVSAYNFMTLPQVPVAIKAIMGTVGTGLFGAMYVWPLYRSITQAIEQNRIGGLIHGHVNPAGNYAHTVDAVLNCLINNPALKNAFPDTAGIATFNQAASIEALKLVQALKTDTFLSQPSFFSLRGRILATYKMMRANKDHFIGSMKALGKLDAYLSIAKLYKAHASNETNRFCFANYEQATTPHMALENFWMPMLDPKIAVPNNIELGGTVPRSIVVTGPNAGGKSTALKGICVAALFAQTLGIVPATTMTFTPFTLIKTYMNLADTTGEASLFQAEMRRIQRLLKAVDDLPAGQFALVIPDEIFTGTNAEEAAAGGRAVLEHMIKRTNCIGIFATHFKQLTTLEASMSDMVKNYKVAVTKNDNGTFTFHYKLEPGVSNQAIALALMQQEGFNADIIASAQANLLANNTKKQPYVQ